MIQVGDIAPDFKLRDHTDRIVQLSKLKGKKILLSFRPLAWTPVCTDQMKSIEEHCDQLKNLNTMPFGIGVDSMYSNKAWAEVMEIGKLRLLSDFWPHGEVAKSFGVFREKDGFSERANIIMDEEHKVIFAKVYPVLELPDVDELISFLESK